MTITPFHKTKFERKLFRLRVRANAVYVAREMGDFIQTYVLLLIYFKACKAVRRHIGKIYPAAL